LGDHSATVAIAADDPRPQPPPAPDPLDCCGEGCVRCIYDGYDDALEAHRTTLAAWLARHPEAA
jgi:hypothetical protein